MLNADGSTSSTPTGPVAWQTVFSFHLHVIPRYEDDPLQAALDSPWRWGRRGGSRAIAKAAEETMADTSDAGSEGATRQKSAPVRLERDGNLAVMVLDSPPLNLFGGGRLRARWSMDRRG